MRVDIPEMLLKMRRPAIILRITVLKRNKDNGGEKTSHHITTLIEIKQVIMLVINVTVVSY